MHNHWDLKNLKPLNGIIEFISALQLQDLTLTPKSWHLNRGSLPNEDQGQGYMQTIHKCNGNYRQIQYLEFY